MLPSPVRLLARGAFADVFDLGDGTVVKVFRRSKQTHAEVRDWSDHEFLVRQCFEKELLAYETLQAQSELLPYLPAFHGRFDCGGLDLRSSSLDEPLMLDCALRVERCGGRDTKIAHLDAPLQQRVEEVLTRMRALVRDIDVWDASCFVPGSRAEFCVIDFALWEPLSELQTYLDEHGTLPEALRQRVRVRAA